MFKPNHNKEILSSQQSKIDNEKQEARSFRLTSDISVSKKTKIILIIFLVFFAIIAVGNYHIVLNATDITRAFVFIKRPYFGFSDILGDINACTGVPYYSVMLNHPSLCKALQNAGYLEGEKERSKRIQREVQQEFNNSFSETSECLKRCELNQSDTNNYLRCLDSCYLK